MSGAVLVAACLALLASPASAAKGYGAVGEFGEPGAGSGQFSSPRDVAVESSTGNVLVADRDNNRVQVFAPGSPATYLTEFGVGTLAAPHGIAIDQSNGAVYVTSALDSTNRIFKFLSDGQPTPTYSLDETFTSPVGGTAAGEVGAFDVPLAVDPTSGDLLVADRLNDRVSRYESDGSFVSSFNGFDSPGGAFTGLLDIATDSTGDVLVVDVGSGTYDDVVGGFPSRVERFGSAGAWEQTIGTGTPSVGAVTTDPDNDEVLLSGNWSESWNLNAQLRIFTFEADGTAITDFPLDASTVWSIVPGIAVDGGATDRLYAVTDLYSSFGKVSVQAFLGVEPGPPVAATGQATPKSNNATLRGNVTPSGAETSYWFEYGETTAYGSSVPASQDASAGGGVAPVNVARTITGLSEGTTYHYRLVATNAEGTAYGDDRTFKTLGGQVPTPGAGNGRGYEMVSPVDKNGNDIKFEGAQSALDGDSVAYLALGAVGEDPQGATPVSTAISRRTATGWGALSLTAPQTSTFINLSGADLFSDDLAYSAVVNQNRTLTPDAEPGEFMQNIYRQDTTTRGYQLMSLRSGSSVNNVFVIDGSSDLSHIAFVGEGPLRSGDPNVGRNAYEGYVDENGESQMRLVSVLPDGTPSPDGGVIGSNGSGHRAVSEDGSRIYFSTGFNNGQYVAFGPLYRRDDGATTIEVSESQRNPPEAEHRPAFFWTASPDGSRVLFSSFEKLTDDSNADPANGSPSAGFGDLYLYDSDSGDLTALSASAATGGRTVGVAGYSDDLSTVYLVDEGELTADATPGSPNLYRWREGAGLDHIAVLDADAKESWLPDVRTARTTPDGSKLLFTTKAQLTAHETGGHVAVYLYDAEADALECVSCGAGGTQATSDAYLRPPLSGFYTAYRPIRNLTDDGRSVFFMSAQALVAEDVNGYRDVYEYDTATGELSLISSGRGDEHSDLVDASPSGDDVFFITREQLVGWDVDQVVDLTPGGVGGGFPEPPPPPAVCAGDDCQPAPTPRPDLAGAGSGGKDGGGNVAPGPRPRFAAAKIGRGQAARLLRTGRLTVTVRVNVGGRVRVALRARVGGRQVTLAKGAKMARRAGRVRIGLRLGGKARRQLALARNASVATSFSKASERRVTTVALPTRTR